MVVSLYFSHSKTSERSVTVGNRKSVFSRGCRSYSVLTLFGLCTVSILALGIMDRLASDRQEQLRKSSTERLRVKLIKFGWDDDQVMEMDRPTLVEAAAEICLADEQASVAA